jgi:hypothetical protein
MEENQVPIFGINVPVPCTAFCVKFFGTNFLLDVLHLKIVIVCTGDAILRALEGQLTTLQGRTIDYRGTTSNQKNTGKSHGFSYWFFLQYLQADYFAQVSRIN